MTIWIARADLRADSSLLSTGTLIFTQPDIIGSPVRVTGRLFNLMPNTRYHGFHVHLFALPDGEWNCSKAGDHWNPYGEILHSLLPIRFLIFEQECYTVVDSIPLNIGMWVISVTSGEDCLSFYDESGFLFLGLINLARQLSISKTSLFSCRPDQSVQS